MSSENGKISFTPNDVTINTFVENSKNEFASAVAALNNAMSDIAASATRDDVKFGGTTTEVVDTLGYVMNRQIQFQERLEPGVFSKDCASRTAFIKEHSIHLNQEINEMLYELPYFKPWKDYSGITVEEEVEGFNKAKKEYIDALHFFVNIGIMLGLDSDTILHMYKEKNAENIRRQDEGYTHDKSYHQN